MPRRTIQAVIALALVTATAACSSTQEPIPGGSSGSGGGAGTTTGGFGGTGTGGTSVIAGGTGAGTGGSHGGAAGSVSVGGGGTAGGGMAGAGTAGSGTAGSGGATVEASFATLKAMLPVSCYGGVCHDLKEHPLYLGDASKLYETLTTRSVEGCGPLIKPGSPQESALIKLLKGPCGGVDRMPLNACSVDGDEACIKPEVIAALEKWIMNGAPQ
jgi:hypothetical protein